MSFSIITWNKKQNYVTWIQTASSIVYIKTEDIYIYIAKYAEIGSDTSSYELERPLPKRKKLSD